MRRILIAAGLCLVLAVPAAATAKPVQQNNTNAVWFENWIGLSRATMRVATPDGEISDVKAEHGSPVFTLSPPVADGVYRYELRAAMDEMVKNRDYDKDGINGTNEEFVPKSLYITGYFTVERGVIIRSEGDKEEAKDE